MAVAAHVVLPGVTKEQYDQGREAVGWLGSLGRQNLPPDLVGRLRLPQR